MSEETPTQAKARKVAEARARLAAAYAANPDAARAFNARIARLDAVKRRERERFEHLVLGQERPKPIVSRPKRHGKTRTVKTPVDLAPDVERQIARREAARGGATPETYEHYLRAHRGSLAQLRENGTIDAGQLASAEAIRMAAEEAASDVATRIVSYEPRIDRGSSGRDDLLIEGLSEARRAVAYSLWRDAIPHPHSAVLDMLTGQPVGYSLVARHYRMDHRRAKAILIKAIDLWPACYDEASVMVTRASLAQAHRRVA